jgi:5-dehydro-4-deoxyglucarate dehydratase
MTDIKDKLKGVLGFPLTPFNQDLSLNLEALEKNVDEMTQHPFCAIVSAGGTGEVYSMTPEESVEVVRVSVKAAAGRMPVIGGVGFNLPMSIYMAREMEKAGAEALLVVPPYYINAPEEGMIHYFEQIGRACGLPLSFYSRDWAAFTPQQVARLAERVPSLQIWKDGQGDARKYHRIMTAVGDRLAWLGGIGDDCAPAYFGIGCQAYTSSISTINPKMSLAIAEAGLSGDRARMNQIMGKYVHPLYAIRDRVRGYEVSAMKAAQDLLGMYGGPVRPPLVDCKPADIEDLRKLMELYKAF